MGQTSPAVNRVFAKLLAASKFPTPYRNGFRALCPAHDDHDPSLDIDVGQDGRALLKCRADCKQEAILAALGLQAKDLFLSDEEKAEWAGGPHYNQGNGPNTRTAAEKGKENRAVSAVRSSVRVKNDPNSTEQQSTTMAPSSDEVSTGLTIEEYAKAKHLDVDYLKALGLQTIYVGGTPAVAIPYRDEGNQVVSVQLRWRMKKHEQGDGRFTWSSKGAKPILYGLWRLFEMRKSPTITVVEGASDAQTLWLHSFAALGLPSAGGWKEEWLTYFDGFDTIYVVIEPDTGGQAVTEWVSKSEIRHRAKFVSFDFCSNPNKVIKDVSDLHLHHEMEFQAFWEAALKQSVPWDEWKRSRDLANLQQTFGTAKGLLEDPNLMPRLHESMQAWGYVGDTTAPRLTYTAMTSRLLDAPMNAAVIGASSIGKNATVDCAKDHMPADQIHEVDAASPLALVYTDADFEHKVVLFTEADSIPEDGPAGSAVRSLATKNALVYDVVEKSPRGKHHTRRITKRGPTVLITTSTKSPSHQLGTRILEIGLNDLPEQTWEILTHQASSAAGKVAKKPDLTPWIELQKWLGLQPKQVMIPFGATIIDRMKRQIKAPPTRFRRDFQQLLTCIRTIALLHQLQREQTKDGAIIATVDDYGHARELLDATFKAISSEGLTKTVRETVEKVQADERVSVRELSRRLGLSVSATSDRVQKALKGGWLVNTEEREAKHLPLKLARGAPLPPDRSVLPTKDELAAAINPPEPPTPQGPAGMSDDCSVPKVPEQTTEQQVSVGDTKENRDCSGVRSDAGVIWVPPVSVDETPDGPIPETYWPDFFADLEYVLQQETAEKEAHHREPDAQPQVTDTATAVGASYAWPPFEYVTSVRRAEEVVSTLRSCARLGLDIETAREDDGPIVEKKGVQDVNEEDDDNSLDPFGDRIRLVQISTGERTYIFDIDRLPLVVLAPLMHTTKEWVGHNLLFELKFLVRNGLPYPVGTMLDTQQAYRILHGGTAKAAKQNSRLKDVAFEALGVTLAKDARLQKGWNGELSQEKLRYAASDAAVVLPFIAILATKLRDEGLWDTAMLEWGCLKATAWMTLAGIPIDIEAWAKIAEVESARAADLLERLHALTDAEGVRRLNWNSAKAQVLPYLQRLGLDITRTKAEDIEPYRLDYPGVDLLLDYREASKRVSTYGENWLREHINPVTGRVHSSFDALGTATGRFSSHDPNVQNFPRAEMYRRTVRAPEGSVIIKLDFSQIELRWVAIVAPDENMLKIYHEGRDAHKETAAGIRNCTIEALQPGDRQGAKPINFGNIYGAGANRIRIEAKKTYHVEKTLEQVKEEQKAWFKLYPGIADWQKERRRDLQRCSPQEARTAIGRRRLDITKIGDFLNLPIQGSAADGLKAGMVRLFEHRHEHPEAKMINVIHDEVLIECLKDGVDDVKQWARKHLEDGMQEVIRKIGEIDTPMDDQVGRTWAG